MAKSGLISLCFLLVILTTHNVISQGYDPYADDFFERHTPPNQFYSPFDAWRKNFPPSTDGSTQFWPTFHNFEPDFRRSDPESTFSSEERTPGPNERENREPFEIDVIRSSIPSASVHDDTTLLLHHAIPFFENHPFFSTFGGFGFGKRKEPWWKGPNVCTERLEEIEEPDDSETASNNNDNKNSSDDVVVAADEKSDTEIVQKPIQFFTGIQFSVNSCIEKPYKHICKQVYSKNGRKKTLTVTHQCCHGYGRLRNAEITTPCEKLDLKPLIDTAEEIGAKEFIRSAKNNGLEEKLKTNVTLFLPTDNAFTEFSEQMFENNLVVLPLTRTRRATSSDSSGITTNELALHHMVDGWINMEDVKNEQLLTTNYDNLKIRINLFPKPPNNQQFEYPFRYTANCAPIIKLNKLTTNGFIHVIDRVLPPVTKNVMDIIRERSDMAVLKTILEKTGVNALLESDRPVTIFAPTDKAFEKLEMHLKRTLKEAKGCAKNILKNHILDLTFCSVAVVSDAKTTAYNVLGQAMTFERSNLNDSQNPEIADLTGIQDIIVNGQAKIIENDVMGTNGVIHVVDTIMQTDTALPITSLLERKNLTIFKQLIEVSGLEDEFDDLSNVTFFAPTDKAFEGNVWKKRLEENPGSLKNDLDLKEFLQYHVVEPLTKTCDLTEKKIQTKLGPELRVNLYSTHALFMNIMNRATVNCARLVHFDDESCGTVLHQVDKVLTPPKTNLLQALESNPDYSMFLNLIKSANLTQLLEDDKQSFTLLVPKNDIFLEVEGWYKNLFDNSNELDNLIKSHIVNEIICCAGIIPTNWPFVRTIETINNNELRISRDRRPKIENAGITKCDIIANNGILHEINDVINVKKRNLNPDRHHISSFEDILF